VSSLPGSPIQSQNHNDSHYDPTLYAKADEVSTLSKKVEDLEKQFGSNEKIADTLCRVSERDTKIQEMFAATFVKMLKTNDASREAIEELIRKTDRSDVASFWKRFGAVVWTVSGVVITLLAQAIPTLIQHLIGGRP
jgi:transketolase